MGCLLHEILKNDLYFTWHKMNHRSLIHRCTFKSLLYVPWFIISLPSQTTFHKGGLVTWGLPIEQFSPPCHMA